MKRTTFFLAGAGALYCILFLSACGDMLWQAAQLPGLRGVNDRMNERATLRRLGGDPLQELTQTTQQGDYRFLGLMDIDSKRIWAPGVPAGSYPAAQIIYLVTNRTETWTPSAIRYFSIYNRALVTRRHGKKLDDYGILIQ